MIIKLQIHTIRTPAVTGPEFNPNLICKSPVPGPSVISYIRFVEWGATTTEWKIVVL